MILSKQPQRTHAQVAVVNLSHAKAALMTARQRLADAEERFAQSLECGADFTDPADAHSSLAWWRAQVEQAERAVSELEKGLNPK
jgi:hypothetical protein